MSEIIPNDHYDVRLTGNYGTFTVMKVVTVLAESREHAEELAFEQTGIGEALQKDGIVFTSSPDGEEWTIEILRKF